MISTLKRALALLQSGERKQYPWLLGLSTMAAVAQAAATLALMPFIFMLASPDLMSMNPWLQKLPVVAGLTSEREVLILLGIGAFVALLIGNIVAAVDFWIAQGFLCRAGHRLETRTLRAIVSQPFEAIADRHGGALGDVVWNQVERVVDGVIGSSIAIVGQIALVVFIVGVLLVVNPVATLVTLTVLVAIYVGVFLTLQERLARHGMRLTELSGVLVSTAEETLEGMHEIRTRRAEGFFVRRFERTNRPLARLALQHGLLTMFPNLLLETLILGGLVAIALTFIAFRQDSGAAVAYVALYGMAAYRLIPALRAVFQGLAGLRHDAEAVNAVAIYHGNARVPAADAEPISRAASVIRFDSITYRYPNALKNQLDGVSFEVPVGGSVCLFGESGSGKSTLIQILVGLLTPTQGTMSSDGAPIRAAQIDSWRQQIGYCPQHVYIFDDSVASNIAFGLDPGEIDVGRIERAAAIAMVDSFTVDVDEDGYGRRAGSKGGSLSGGQRQRIGIARALYHDPPIIVLDEAFSGLDVNNRDSILDRLLTLHAKTLVLSSHDLAVAERCDQVIEMASGRLLSRRVGNRS